MTPLVLLVPLFAAAPDGAPSADPAAAPETPAAIDPEIPPSAPVAVRPVDAPQSSAETSTARTANNAVFLEGFGSGLLYSVNYERMLGDLDVGLRVGFSYFTYSTSSYGRSGNLSILSVPMLVSYYPGWGSHRIQLGLGATVIYTDAPTDSQGTSFGGDRAGAGLSASAVVGYRYMPKHGGFTFGAGFTPLLRGSKALPWGGANAGWIF